MLAALFAGLLGGIGLLLAWCVGALVFIFWLWMLIHAITNKGLSDIEKLIWVLVIIFTHALGALVYFIVGRPKGRAAVV